MTTTDKSVVAFIPIFYAYSALPFCCILKHELLMDSPVYSSLCSQYLVLSRCSVNISSIGPVRKGQRSLVWLPLPLRSTVGWERMKQNRTGRRGGRERETGERERACLFTQIIELRKRDCPKGTLLQELCGSWVPTPALCLAKGQSLFIPHHYVCPSSTS